jgi:CheY-like chemotaxis protein
MVHSGRKSIMVIEDDVEARESLAAVLASEGYSVIVAEHGRAALDTLRRAPSDVCMILLDLFMPVMNGWAFRDAQVRDPALADIPVVVITADASAAQRMGKHGVVGTMTKPLDFDRLLAVVNRYC